MDLPHLELADDSFPDLWSSAVTDPIARSVGLAVMAGRIPPGLRLGEDLLAGLYGVSRTVVRRALQQLAFTGIVLLVPNRGATVASPTHEDVEQTYAARRLIEAEICRDVARHITAADVRRLRAHLQRQVDAELAGDRARHLILLSEFHLKLAEFGSNRVLAGMLAQLVPLTALMQALYDSPEGPSCGVEDHAALIDALAAGKGDHAAHLMEHHLQSNQKRLNPLEPPGRDFDLKAALGF